MNPITHTIRATHFWYGPKETHSYECRGTLEQCKQWVADSANERYYLTHGESTRPLLRIVRLDSLGPRALAQANWAATIDEYMTNRA